MIKWWLRRQRLRPAYTARCSPKQDFIKSCDISSLLLLLLLSVALPVKNKPPPHVSPVCRSIKQPWEVPRLSLKIICRSRGKKGIKPSYFSLVSQDEMNIILCFSGMRHVLILLLLSPICSWQDSCNPSAWLTVNVTVLWSIDITIQNSYVFTL